MTEIIGVVLVLFVAIFFAAVVILGLAFITLALAAPVALIIRRLRG